MSLATMTGQWGLLQAHYGRVANVSASGCLYKCAACSCAVVNSNGSRWLATAICLTGKQLHVLTAGKLDRRHGHWLAH